MSAILDDLGEHLAKNQLLREVLGADHDPVRLSYATRDRKQKQRDDAKRSPLRDNCFGASGNSDQA
jgi:hypothetical protein